MSITGEIKVGDKIKPGKNCSWSLTYGESEVVGVSKNDQGRPFAWLLLGGVGGVGGPRQFTTIAISALHEQWERVSQFFKIGRKYSSSTTWNVGAVYHIQELYLLDNPDIVDDKSTAVAKVTKADGTQYIITLNSSDFKNMKEIA